MYIQIHRFYSPSLAARRTLPGNDERFKCPIHRRDRRRRQWQWRRAAARRSPKHRIDEENQDEQKEPPIYIAGAAVLHRSGMFAWKRELHRTTNVSLLCRLPAQALGRGPISSIFLGYSLTNIKFINGATRRVEEARQNEMDCTRGSSKI